jgi:hypothetical protein
MFLFGLIKNIFVIIVIIAIIVGVTMFSAPAKNALSQLPGGKILGTQSDRSDEIKEQLSKDVNYQVDNAKKQTMNIKVSDVVNSYTRLQKIPTDLNSAELYLQNQIRHVIYNK